MHVRTAALAALVGVGGISPFPLRAQTPEEDRRALEKKIEALEKQQAEMQKQLEELKSALAARPTPTPTPTPTPPAPEPAKTGPVTSPGLTPYPVATWGETGQVTSGTTFNPAMSVVAEGLYFADDREGHSYNLFPQADGFAGTGVGGLPDLASGFNLGETEFSFSAAVDPYFDALAILTADTESVGIEEAWIRTRRLLPGLSIKAGRFYSDVGYVNKQHPTSGISPTRISPTPCSSAARSTRWACRSSTCRRRPSTSSSAPRRFRDERRPRELPRARSEPRLLVEGRAASLHRVRKGLARRRLVRRPPAWVSGGYDTKFQEQTGDVASEGTSWFGGLDAVFKHDDPRPSDRET